MFELIEEAKNKKQAIVFKNYLTPTLTWEDIVSHIYRESVKWDEVAKELEERTQKIGDAFQFNSIGRIQIQNQLWLSPQQKDLFEEFPQIADLLYKLNKGVDNRECSLYDDSMSGHDCDSDWHPQGIRISLSNRIVPDHHDPWDVFYWQIVGTSFWKVDNDITYELEPGDLLYLPVENSHEVWCDGPRAGLLIDNFNTINTESDVGETHEEDSNK